MAGFQAPHIPSARAPRPITTHDSAPSRANSTLLTYGDDDPDDLHKQFPADFGQYVQHLAAQQKIDPHDSAAKLQLLDQAMKQWVNLPEPHRQAFGDVASGKAFEPGWKDPSGGAAFATQPNTGTGHVHLSNQPLRIVGRNAPSSPAHYPEGSTGQGLETRDLNKAEALIACGRHCCMLPCTASA